jgi:YD repeat-containing protein
VFFFGANRYYGSVTKTGIDKLVVNRSDARYGNADFGRGWSLVGLQELLLTRTGQANDTPLYRDRTVTAKVDNSLPIGFVDGNGQTIVYRPSDKQGNILHFVGPRGDYSKLEKNLIDGSHRRTMIDQTVYVFDAWGQLESVTDRNLNQTTYSYDNKGHLIGITDPVGLQTLFTVVGDRITEMRTPDGRVVKFNYAGNDLQKITDPEAGERSWTYDADNKGRLTTFTDERKNTGTDHYDQWGRVDKATLRDGTVKSFTVSDAYLPVYESRLTRNPNSAPSVVSIPSERTNTTIDGKGQTITRKINKEGLISEVIDDLGIRESTSIRSDGRPQQVTDQYGFVTSYDYDYFGNTTSIVDGAYDFTLSPTRVFGDVAGNSPLLEQAERILEQEGHRTTGIGNATQTSFAVGDDGKTYYVIGTNQSYLIVASGLTAKELKTAPKSEKDRVLVRSVTDLRTLIGIHRSDPTSLQQIRVLANGGIAIGYDRHAYDKNNGSTKIGSTSDLGYVTSTTATVIPDTALKTNQLSDYYLSDTRKSDIDFNAKGEYIFAYVGKDGILTLKSDRNNKIINRNSFANDNIFSPQQFNFAVGDVAVGDYNADGLSDIAAINALDEVSRPQFQVLESKGAIHEAPPGNRRDNASWNPPNSNYSDTFLSNGKGDYFAVGRKLATVNIGDQGGDDLVVATIGTAGGGQSWLSFYKSNANREFDLADQVKVPYYVTALQSYNTVADPLLANSLAKPAGHGVIYTAGNLYMIPDATNPQLVLDYGAVGNVQGLVSADFDGDGINDIALADNHQNLKVYLLDKDHNVKGGGPQVSHINVKPRQLVYAEGKLLITDGGSGLDILKNDYLAAKQTSPAAQGLVSKTFTYDKKFNQLLEYSGSAPNIVYYMSKIDIYRQ